MTNWTVFVCVIIVSMLYQRAREMKHTNMREHRSGGLRAGRRYEGAGLGGDVTQVESEREAAERVCCGVQMDDGSQQQLSRGTFSAADSM